MSLRDVTRAIIAKVEQSSGYPVLITEDRALRTLVAMRMARGNAPVHTITYNPSVTTQPDYLIAFQCGFILRHFANPPKDGQAYEVEFVALDGHTAAVVTLEASQVRPISHREITHARELSAAGS